MEQTNTTAIQSAADQIGVPAIAGACGISVQAVYKWIRKGQAPAERCEAISRATGWRVPTLDLLPPSLRSAVTPQGPRIGRNRRRAPEPQ